MRVVFPHLTQLEAGTPPFLAPWQRRGPTSVTTEYALGSVGVLVLAVACLAEWAFHAFLGLAALVYNAVSSFVDGAFFPL